MAITIVTPPSEEPLTLTEAKIHLRVDHTDDDALITSLIFAARQYVEQYLQRAIITQTLRLTMDAFPDGDIKVYPSLQSITSIKYIDTDGVLQTWPTANYLVDTYSLIGRVSPAYGDSYPDTRNQLNAIEIVFIAGYGVAADVPQSIKQAMFLIIGHWYENREAINIDNTVNELPLAVDALLAPYCILNF